MQTKKRQIWAKYVFPSI